MREAFSYYLRVALILAVGLVLLLAIDRILVEQVEENYEEQAEGAASQISGGVRSFALNRFAVLVSVRDFFETHENVTKQEFDRFAAALIRDTPEIRSLQWANQDAVVTWVHPLEGNEAAVGHDLLATPNTRPFVQKAIREHVMTVNDPYELKQGGLGVIARAPIFRNNQFAGLNIAVLDVPTIIDEAITAEITEGYHVRMRDSKGKTFWVSEKGALFGADTVTSRLKLGDNFWQIDVHQKPESRLPVLPIRGAIWFLGALGMISLTLWARGVHRKTVGLEEAVMKRTRHLENLSSVSASLTKSFEVEPMLSSALNETLTALDLEMGAVVTVIPGTNNLRLTASMGLPEAADEILRATVVGEGPIGAVAKDGVPIVDGAALFSGQLEALAEATGVKTLLAWPMRAHEQIAGVLILMSRRVREFSLEEKDFIITLASQIGLAQVNASRLQYQRDIAVSLQESLLSKMPHPPSLDVGKVYASATPEAAIGGDFYDLFALPDKRLAFVIGDVSGKGIAAAATGVLIRNTIRTLAHEDPEPARLSNKLNRLVTDYEMRKGGFTTLFYGVFDPESGNLTYVCCGHPCPGVLLPDGRFKYCICEYTLPLGVFPDTLHLQSTMTIETGGTLFLFTDGVLEARSGKTLYGNERLARFVSELAGKTAQELANALFEDARRFAGGQLADDLAILTLRRR